tara:strand:+ start:3911 stop:6181 length:2271 start_codon:yes stop_codon:yes gene_type:complete
MPTYGKDNFKESNVNYLNKDFASLKQSLMDYAKSYFPDTYRDFNETSPGMMLLEMNAYVGDVLSFYVDQQYREMLLPLSEERRNILNLAKMFGYKVKPIVPAYADLTFTQNLTANSSNRATIDYSTGAVIDRGLQVKGTTNGVVFETLEVLDFKISQSNDTSNINTFDSSTNLASDYSCERVVRAVSGKTKTSTFTIGVPEKFKKITLSDTNIIDIISCVDSNGNNWYEVDFLAQDKVPIETHYTNDSNRESAYSNALDNSTSDIAVPFSLQYIKTSKRFTRETNVDNTTSLVFGNGVLKNGTLIDTDFIDLEQVGVVVPGQANDLNETINPLLGDEYSTLGETPNNTTLTITYRVGGGIDANLPSGDLTIIQDGTAMNGSGGTISDLTVNNTLPARGGKDEETIDEIREKTKAFFSTQNRCVTKEDYEARVLNIPARFGNIAKVYVTRSGDDTTPNANQQLFSNALTSLDTKFGKFIDELNRLKNAMYDIPNQNGNGYIVTTEELNDFARLLDTSPDEIEEVIRNIGGYSDLTTFDLSSVNIYILAYNNLKELVGNPIEQDTSIPVTIQQNIKNYLSNFRMLTDSVSIINGYIVNFGVFFDVVAEKYADKNQVKIKCIEKIKEYFQVEKMQFNQPIYKSQLEFELMGVEGVRSLNHLTITQKHDDYFGYNSDGEFLGTADQTLDPNPTYLYSFNADIDNGDGTYGGFESNGTDGYGYYYDFQDALVDGIIRPPEPSTPAVFELKNPNQNIQGRVR